MAERRPFHETIIGAINCASFNQLLLLAKLIDVTKIPAGHDEIIAAWREKTKGMGFTGAAGLGSDITNWSFRAEERNCRRSRIQAAFGS